MKFVFKIAGLAMTFIVVAFFASVTYNYFDDISDNNEIQTLMVECRLAKAAHEDVCQRLIEHGIYPEKVRSNDKYFKALSNKLIDDTIAKANLVQELAKITLEYITPPSASVGIAVIEKYQEMAK